MDRSKKCSSVWNHFDLVPPNKVKCRLCPTELSYINKNTSSMLRHYRARHGNEELADTRKSTPVPNKQAVDEAVVNMIIKDSHECSFVENEGFRELLKLILPSYTLPSSKTIKNLIVSKRYKKKIKKEIQSAVAVTSTAGAVEEARGILKSLKAAGPSQDMVRLQQVMLERRHGNLEKAEALLREDMESAKNATETSFYAVKLARQLMKVQRNPSKARKVLLDAIKKDQTNPKLYLNLLELESSGDVTQNEAEILACFDRALQSQMPIESRLFFSQRKVEFLEDFGSDINVLAATYEEHQKLQKESEPTKWKAENGYDSCQEPDSKRQRVDDGSAGAANAMTDMQANNSAYNYNWYQQQYEDLGPNSWEQHNQCAQYNQNQLNQSTTGVDYPDLSGLKCAN